MASSVSLEDFRKVSPDGYRGTEYNHWGELVEHKSPLPKKGFVAAGWNPVPEGFRLATVREAAELFEALRTVDLTGVVLGRDEAAEKVLEAMRKFAASSSRPQFVKAVRKFATATLDAAGTSDAAFVAAIREVGGHASISGKLVHEFLQAVRRVTAAPAESDEKLEGTAADDKLHEKLEGTSGEKLEGTSHADDKVHENLEGTSDGDGTSDEGDGTSDGDGISADEGDGTSDADAKVHENLEGTSADAIHGFLKAVRILADNTFSLQADLGNYDNSDAESWGGLQLPGFGYSRTQILELIAAFLAAAGPSITSSSEYMKPDHHELVPGKDEAFSLKDGYLFNFGAVRSFYPNYQSKFTITHKLVVSCSCPGVDPTTQSNCDVELELLHACEQEDEKKIRDLVESNQLQRGDSHEAGSNIGEDGSRLRNTGLAVLLAQTPWINGGTALHFSARAEKLKSVKLLLQLNRELSQTTKEEDDDDDEDDEDEDEDEDEDGQRSNLIFVEDFDGNIALCSAALTNAYSSEAELLLPTRGEKSHRRRQFKHKNLWGLTAVEIAAKEGCLMTWVWDMMPMDAVLDKILYKASYFYLCHYAETVRNTQEERQSLWHLDIKEYWWQERRSMSTLQKTFLKALQVGFSKYCLSFLSNRNKVGRAQVLALSEHDYYDQCDDCDGNNILHLYVLGGADQEVGKMLVQMLRQAGRLDNHINSFNLQGLTPYMLAAQKGHQEACDVLKPYSNAHLLNEYFIKGPYSNAHLLNEYFVKGFNVMHCYASSAKLSVSSWLVPENVGELVNTKDEKGNTPLMCALRCGHTEACEWLLECAYDVEVDFEGALHMYARGGAGAKAGEKLLRKLGNEKVISMINQQHGYDKETPLMLALRNGNVDACNVLLDEVDKIRVSFKEVDWKGNNLLHCWCEGGLTDKELWQKLTCGREDDVAQHINTRNHRPLRGADPFSGEETPFMRALSGGKTEVCRWLLEERTDDLIVVGDDDSNSKTNVFHSFARGGCTDRTLWERLKAAHSTSTHENMLKMALNAASESDHTTTPLMLALQSKSEDCALLFLREEVVNTQLADSANRSVLHYAAEYMGKSFKVWAELMRRRSTWSKEFIQKKDRHFRRTALMWAAAEGSSLEVFEMLLHLSEEHDVKFWKGKDWQGATVVSLAAGNSAAHLQLLENLHEMNFSGRGDAGLAAAARELLRLFPDRSNKRASREPLLSSVRHHSVSACSWLLNKIGSSLEQDVLNAAVLLAIAYNRRRDEDDRKDEGLGAVAILKILLKKMEGAEEKKWKALQDLRVGEDKSNLLHVAEAPQVISFISKKCPDLLVTKDEKGRTPLFTSHSLKKTHTLIQCIMKYSGGMKPLEDAIQHLKDVNHKTTLLHMQIEKFEKVGKIVRWIPEQRLETLKDEGGETILHAACRKGVLRVVRLLLKTNGRLMDVSSSGGKTPFHVAAGAGQVHIVEELLLHHRNRNVDIPQLLLHGRDGDGRTALHFAAKCEDDKALEVVKLLLEKAGEKYKPLLLWASAGPAVGTAIKNAQRPDVKDYLQNEMNPFLSSSTPDGLDLLERAAEVESIPMVKELVNRGADVRALHESKPGILEEIQLNKAKEADLPTLKDSLGRRKLAKGIAALLLNPFTAMPITVGVLAPWGMGKSSLMLQIEMGLMMTIIERNLLPVHRAQDDFPSKIKNSYSELTSRGIELRKHVLEIAEKYKRKDFPTSKWQTCKRLAMAWINRLWSSWRQRAEEQSQREKDDDELHKFFSDYKPDFLPLYKGLALMERRNLVISSAQKFQHKDIATQIPSFLTMRYNAWTYHGETEASAGLALTILEEMEECMGTAGWLRLCWKCAYRMDPTFMVTGLLLPALVCVVVGGWILWLVWRLMSINNNEILKDFRYGSIPVTMVVVTWIVLRNVMNVVKPISQKLVQSFQGKKGHQQRLGYQNQVIDDIQLFKKELSTPPSCVWRVLGGFWSILIQNKNYIKRTKIAKVPVPEKNLRIVVFVDDLDRCSNETYVIELLAAINLILSKCEINVVLGVDKRFIQKAISKVYQNEEAETKFLEKIIQVPVDLYEPSKHDMSVFLDEQLIGQKPKISNPTLQDNAQSSQPVGQTSATNDNANQHDSETDTSEVLNEDSNINASNAPEVTSSNKSPQNRKWRFLTLPCWKMADASNASEVTSSNNNKKTPHHPTSPTVARNELVVDFPVLVANYTEAEVKAFQYLHPKARGDHTQPRNWKRLLNYHRLAWSIISQSQSQDIQNLYGWQEQLIVWVFLCFNWKEQMDDIFENWDELVPQGSSDQVYTPPLSSIIQKRISQLLEGEQQSNDHPKDINHKKQMKQWKELQGTLNETYDVSMLGIRVFQNFRFHCNAGYLA